MEHYSDDQLLSLFREESSRNYAYNLMVRKYQERIYWHIIRIVIMHEDADDVTQNTLVKAILRLPEKQRLVFNMLRYYEEMKSLKF